MPPSATATPPLTAPPTRRVVTIAPQKGPQEAALACPADILIYGGAAGGGKTWALLLDPIHYIHKPGFGATIFRRTLPEVTKQGGMWEESWKLYPQAGGKANANDHTWTFPKGSSVQFGHLQHDKDKYHYQGAQLAMIGFDQLESFLEGQFWYLVSRNRTMCGIDPYVRATCNPIPEDDPVGGWLHRLIQWWIDPTTGLAMYERSGVIRYFVRLEDKIEWADMREELLARFPAMVCASTAGHSQDCTKAHPQSLTFIHAELSDNKLLERADPSYRSKLLSLPRVERERLLGGNWNSRPTAGMVFNRAWFEIVEAVPVSMTTVRYWDKAGTEGGGCYTAGVKMGKDHRTGLVYVLDVIRGQWSAGAREQEIKNNALTDGTDTKVYTEQEPGSGGKESAQNSVINLQGFAAFADPVRGNKLRRAYPYSAYAEAGNVKILKGAWNADYLSELHNFDPENSGFCDQVDASSGAFNKLALHARSFSMQSGGVSTDTGASVEKTIEQAGYYWPQGLPGRLR